MNTVYLSDADAGKKVSLPVGGRLVVELRENPTTGYAWTVELDTGSAAVLRETPTQFRVAGESAAAGAGGVRAFCFEAAKPGECELRLKLWRDWEGDASVTRRFAARVQVG